MPFSSEFDDVYQIGIKEACQAAGAYCERVDEQHYSEKMLDRIYNQIAKADLIIADMTGKNANVFYEVGYAHALGKPTVLLTQNAADIPFDLTQYLHIVYESKLTVLREKLTSRVLWHINNPTAGRSDTSFPLTLYVNRTNPNLEVISLDPKASADDVHDWYFDVVCENNGTTSLSEDDFKLGIIVENQFDGITFDKLSSRDGPITLANGAKQYTIPFQRGVMPGESQRVSLNVWAFFKTKFNNPERVNLRLFTHNGFRDHVIFLRKS